MVLESEVADGFGPGISFRIFFEKNLWVDAAARATRIENHVSSDRRTGFSILGDEIGLEMEQEMTGLSASRCWGIFGTSMAYGGAPSS